MLIKEFAIDNGFKVNSNWEYLPNTTNETLILFHSNFILKNFDKDFIHNYVTWKINKSFILGNK